MTWGDCCRHHEETGHSHFVRVDAGRMPWLCEDCQEMSRADLRELERPAGEGGLGARVLVVILAILLIACASKTTRIGPCATDACGNVCCNNDWKPCPACWDGPPLESSGVELAEMAKEVIG